MTGTAAAAGNERASASALILASSSPRRRALLEALGLDVRVFPADIDERQWPDETPIDHVQRLALSKANAVWHRPDLQAPQLPVLAADTIVVIDGVVLGKPTDRADALAMLARLSGRAHRVLTALCIVSASGVDSVLSTTEVHFRAISESEAEAYWDTGEPRDKAGAYGIQGIGGIFAARIEGSFTGVMGLPIAETALMLGRAGIHVLSGANAFASGRVR